MGVMVLGDRTAKRRFANLRDRICRKAIGKRLFRQLDEAATTCTVEFQDDEALAGDGGAKAAAWDMYLKRHGRRNVPLKRAIERSGMSFDVICTKINMKWLREIKLTPDGVRQYVDGKPIPSEELWRLIWLLRPYIEPGNGAEATIKIARSIGEEAGLSGVRRHWRSLWGSLKFEEGHVVVFHELIHALRLMQGRRVVDRGWEEEAMTIGLPPFQKEEITENKCRQACHLPIAQKHGDATVSSQTAAIQMMSPNDWGKDDKIFCG